MVTLAGDPGEGDSLRGAEAGVTTAQKLVLATALAALLIAWLWDTEGTMAFIHGLVVAGFTVAAGVKFTLAGVGRAAVRPPALSNADLPAYTVLVPLYREAPVVKQLVAALSALDYPRDRLQAILILEQDDTETLAALGRSKAPPFIQILVKPPGGPRTKPNALNAALAEAQGVFVVVYDAEDIPHPYQLREAAARFALDPQMACVQAPLRISNAKDGFLARQFALEYAGQFDALMPGLERLGCTFPLGGTSNHLRASVLRAVGGWDAYNVTEDADLGLRLGGPWRRVSMIASPTYEDAPRRFADWLPQRARWVKGFMQTWGVQMRDPFANGLCAFLTIQATLGFAILGAALHAGLMLTLTATLIGAALGAPVSPSVWIDLVVLGFGWGMAVLANAIGAGVAGLRMTFLDAVLSLAFWPLQTIAFAVAVNQLFVSPYRWDKTPHTPSAPVEAALEEPPPLDGGGRWSVSPAM